MGPPAVFRGGHVVKFSAPCMRSSLVWTWRPCWWTPGVCIHPLSPPQQMPSGLNNTSVLPPALGTRAPPGPVDSNPAVCIPVWRHLLEEDRPLTHAGSNSTQFPVVRGPSWLSPSLASSGRRVPSSTFRASDGRQVLLGFDCPSVYCLISLAPSSASLFPFQDSRE